MLALMRWAAILSSCSFIAALALVACGSGASSTRGLSTSGLRASASSDTQCTNDATAAAVLTAHAPLLHQSTPVILLTGPDDDAQCRLRRALLTTADLPNAWSESKLGYTHIYETQHPGCRTTWTPMAGVMDSFDAPNATGTLVEVAQWVFAFHPGEAAGLFSALKQNCSSVAPRVSDPYGPGHSIALPALGDESFGIYEGEGVAAVYIRRGDVITHLLVGGKGDLAAPLAHLAATVDAKLAKVGPIPTPTPSR